VKEVAMGGRVPGPVCSSRVGDDWIDDGTLCRAKSAPPGPAKAPANPDKATFDAAHGYSLAPEARRKRAIDLQIIGNDYAKGDQIRIDNESYLKQLIEIGSGGARKVRSDGGKGRLQFFIVRGGAEGFLPDPLRKIDARDNVTHWRDTDGHLGTTKFDENDLIAVFDAGGSLVGAARLRRPTFVETRISADTTRRVYDAWANKTVYVYRNDRRPDWVPYLGLALDDGFRDGTANAGEHVYIDIHKEEATNGCIFIVDPATPALGAAALRTFEPALIRKSLAAAGIDESKVKGGTVLGVMRVVTISL
jgi:hypothetical protein